MIDQIGPLELREGSGWSVAFDVLARGDYGLALVVVNPRVLDRAVWLTGAGTIHTVGSANRGALPAEIAGELLPAAG